MTNIRADRRRVVVAVRAREDERRVGVVARRVALRGSLSRRDDAVARGRRGVAVAALRRRQSSVRKTRY
jgi:hypothetical protein